MDKNKGNTALLVMDMQTALLQNLPDNGGLLANTAKAIMYAREKKIPVIYVRVGFRQGTPEISMNNKGFSAYKERMASVNMETFLQIHPDLTPGKDELVVTKRRVSAFAGSDLEVILRAFEIKHLILLGIATGGVVLSTLREAADKDYQISVLSDACADADTEIHQVLVNKIFVRQADVLTVDAWTKS